MASMNEVAVSAGNCHRAIEALMLEFDRISPDNPRGIDLFDRFLSLHKEFYGHIITLTAEESGIIDEEFKRQVLEESDGLIRVVDYLRTEKGFFKALSGRVFGRSNQMADYFARCVADIFEGYEVDQKTNEIFIIPDEEESPSD